VVVVLCTVFLCLTREFHICSSPCNSLSQDTIMDGTSAEQETQALAFPSSLGGVDKESHKAWLKATRAIVKDSKDTVKKVRESVESLEKREADRIAAEIAERRRQAALAAAAEERRKQEALRRAEEELRASRAAELKARRQEAAAAKHGEFLALKEATRNFHKAIQNENDYKEKWRNIVAMRDASKYLGNAVCHCRHASRMKFSVMMVCEMRLKLREEKPEEESFRDHVHDALESEWQVLRRAREELMDWATQGEDCRSEMQYCEATLITGNSRENVKARQERCPSLPPLAAKSLEETPSVEQLLARAAVLVGKAHELIEKSEEALLRTAAACAAASADTTAAIDKRKSETERIRKNLGLAKKEIKATLSDAEKRVSLLRMRSEKEHKEAALKPKHHRDKATERAHETVSKIGDASLLLVQLQADKKRIDDDFRLKTASYRIDKSCRELTKVRAGSHVSALHPLPPSLSQSQSSPNLTQLPASDD